MTNEKKLLLVPLVLTAIFLIYCWTLILTTDILATWKHYTGLILFFVLIFLFFKNLIAATIGLGVYLLLATFNLLAITAEITTSGIRIGSISTPGIQLLSLGLFIIYFWINFNPLVEIHLDHREKKKRNKKN